MSAEHVEDRLSAWLDGALAPAEAERVERHVKGCARCAAAREALVEQDGALKSALSHDPGEAYFESLSQRVASRLQAGTKPGKGRVGWFAQPLILRWASAAAVLVAGSVVAYYAYQHRGAPSVYEKRSALQERARASNAPPGQPAPSAPQETRSPPPGGAPAAPRELAHAAPEDAAKKLAVDEQGAGEKPPALRPSRMTEMTVPTQPGETPVPKSAVPPAARRQPVSRPTPQPAPGAPIYATKPQAAQPMSAQDRLKAREGQGAAAPGAAPAPVAAPGAPAASAKPTPGASAAPGAPQGVEGQAAAPKGPAEAAKFGQYLYRESLADSHAARVVRGRVLAKDERVGEVQVCGSVSEPGGKPVAGAQVVASNLGRVATTDAAGRFCLALPPGRHDLRVMSVGHVSTTRLLNIGPQGANELAFTVAPVSALGEGLVIGGGATSKEGGVANLRAQGESAPLIAVQKSALNALKQARLSHQRAATKQTAAAWDMAAADWEKALRGVEGSELELEARAGVAECRYRAWKADPTAARSRAATQALTAYLVRAPVGPARDRAAAWVEELK